MTLPISTRIPLIQVSAALYAKNSAKVEEEMSRLPEVSKNKIYGRLWEVMKKPDIHKYGETSFKDTNFPIEKKIEAIEQVLIQDIEPNLPVPQLPQPEKSIKIDMNAFWDTGFDPRFTIDGNFLLDQRRSLKQKAWAIVEIVSYAIFVIKAYCSWSLEERQVRQLILKSAALEKTWSSYYERALIKNIEDPCAHWIPLAEHDFLETMSDLAKRLDPSLKQPRLFPREVLLPFHRMNKPQDLAWTKDKARPKWENSDLVRTGTGYTRLNKNAYTLEGHVFDLLDHHYVPHYLFIHAIQKPGEALKFSCRDIRTKITETAIDFKCAFSFARCKAQLRPAFNQFHQDWENYTNSHELLTEAQKVFSAEDYFAEEYAAFREEVKMPAKAFLAIKYDKSKRPSAGKHDEGDAKVADAYRKHHAETKTGRFLNAIQSTKK